jgi:hypothetical protein
MPAQITESLKRFGVGDDARALLVSRFDGAPEEVRPARGRGAAATMR